MHFFLAVTTLALATATHAQAVEANYAVTQECADAGITNGLQCHLCGPYPADDYPQCQAYRGTFEGAKGFGGLNYTYIESYDVTQGGYDTNPEFYAVSGNNVGYMSPDYVGSAAFPAPNAPFKINKTTTFYGTGLGQITSFYFGCASIGAVAGMGASPCTVTVKTAYNKDGYSRAGEAQFLFNYAPPEQYHRQRLTKERLQFVDVSKLFPSQSYNYTFEVGGIGIPSLYLDNVVHRVDLLLSPLQ